MNVCQQQNLFSSVPEDQEYSPEIRCSFPDPTYRRSSSLPVYFPSLFARADGMELQAYESSSCYLSSLCQLDMEPVQQNNDVNPGDHPNLEDTRNPEDPDRTNSRYQGHSFHYPTDCFSHASYFEDQHKIAVEGSPGSWVPYRNQTYPAGQLATNPLIKVSELRPQSPSCFIQTSPFPQGCLSFRNSPRSYPAQQLGNTALGQRMPDSGYTIYPTDLIPDPSDTGASSNERSSCTSYPKVLRARTERDDFLLRSKSVGMSYREIKAKGRFKEAESTLRGRFRTLTKSKDQRVRKPQWQDHDVKNHHTIPRYRNVYVLKCECRFNCFGKQSNSTPPFRHNIPKHRATVPRPEKGQDLQRFPGSGSQNMWQGVDPIISETLHAGRNGMRSMDLLCRQRLRVYNRDEYRSSCQLVPDLILFFRGGALHQTKKLALLLNKSSRTVIPQI